MLTGLFPWGKDLPGRWDKDGYGVGVQPALLSLCAEVLDLTQKVTSPFCHPMNHPVGLDCFPHLRTAFAAWFQQLVPAGGASAATRL